jgi:hypothetical protein
MRSVRGKFLPATGAAAVIAVLALAGCTTNHSSKVADNALNTPQGKQAKTVVVKCVSTGGANTKAIERCLVPPHHAAAWEACAVKVFGAVGTNKARLENGLATCTLDNR